MFMVRALQSLNTKIHKHIYFRGHQTIFVVYAVCFRPLQQKMFEPWRHSINPVKFPACGSDVWSLRRDFTTVVTVHNKTKTQGCWNLVNVQYCAEILNHSSFLKCFFQGARLLCVYRCVSFVSNAFLGPLLALLPILSAPVVFVVKERLVLLPWKAIFG